MKKILILAANPIDTTRLRLDKEVREISDGLRQSNKRDKLILEHQWAIRPKDLRRAILNSEPEIVHFCGHGDGEQGIALEDDQGNKFLVSTNSLAEFASLFVDHIECIILNACYSKIQAEALAQYIPYVIGMNDAISDNAAIEFSVAFYDSLGAGKSYPLAFKIACNAIQMMGIGEHRTPVLHRMHDTKTMDAPRNIEPPVQFNELALLGKDDLLFQINNIQRSINALIQTIQHLPSADVPAVRLIQIDELKEKLKSYSKELESR